MTESAAENDQRDRDQSDGSLFKWDLVVFKVQDRIFRVPRHGFIESSPIFADMFLMPPGSVGEDDNPVEGLNEDRPIILEGYLEADFEALLKVLYPSTTVALRYSLNLSKPELIGVLKLATVWEMKEIREYAIWNLAGGSKLSHVEQIMLGRAYKVPGWVKDGLIGIASGKEELSYDQLLELGLQTALRILWIKDQLSPLKEYQQDDPKKQIQCEWSSLKCNRCKLVAFKICPTCSSCGREVKAAHLKQAKIRPGARGLTVEPLDLLCPDCGSLLSKEFPTCPRKFKKSHVPEYLMLDSSRHSDTVEEVFKDELADYRLADA